MWPHCLFACPLGLAVSGVDHKDKVYVSVAVIVVSRKVDTVLFVGQCAGIHHHHCRLLVVSVISHFVRQLDRTDHIERWLEHSARLRHEVVAYAAVCIGAGIAFVVRHALIYVVYPVVRECVVLKLSQYDDSAYFAGCREFVFNLCRRCLSLYVGFMCLGIYAFAVLL